MLIDQSKMRRINVVGTSGSGKSTFATELSEILGIEYFEIDALSWKDDWKFCEDKELFEKIKLITDKNEWILDGNYGRTQQIKWRNVQTIIWLDFPFWFVFYRVLKRCIARLMDRKPLWETNNRETFRRSFLSQDSILLWMITSYSKMKKRYSEIFEENKTKWQLIRIQSPKEARMFLDSLQYESKND